ncbi:MAG: phosphoglycerate kinase [Chloroflexota bacterium]
MKQTVRDIGLAGKRILMRVDFNVPLADGRVADDFRIRASLPTIHYILEQGAALVLCSHLGRPKGDVVEALRLDPVARRLSELLEREVQKAEDCVGKAANDLAQALQPGGVLLLENTRFHAGEKRNDLLFAQRLADMGQLFINDAFAAAHRAHASTVGVTHYLPAAAGLLMAKEVDILGRVRTDPAEPLVMVFGGAKIGDKLAVLERFFERLDAVLLCGGMANTFLKASGADVGASLIDEDSLEAAGRLLARAAGRFVLPQDVVVAEAKDAQAERRTVSLSESEVPDGWMILDIGPQTLESFSQRLSGAKTVLWNGPPGVFELPPFAAGTQALARMIAGLDAETISGGGETAAAIRQAGLASQMTHVSTGGGAFLAFMAGQALPALAALKDDG